MEHQTLAMPEAERGDEGDGSEELPDEVSPANPTRTDQRTTTRRLNGERCICGHGRIWGFAGSVCHGNTLRVNGELRLGIPCSCVDHMTEIKERRK